jgi:hypothetical protein
VEILLGESASLSNVERPRPGIEPGVMPIVWGTLENRFVSRFLTSTMAYSVSLLLGNTYMCNVFSVSHILVFPNNT